MLKWTDLLLIPSCCINFVARVIWKWSPVLFHISQMAASVERLHFHSDSVLRDHSSSHQHRKRTPVEPDSSKRLQYDNNLIQFLSHCSNNCNSISRGKAEKRRCAQRHRRRNWSEMPSGETKWLFPLYKQAFCTTPHRLLFWHRKLACLSSRCDILRYFTDFTHANVDVDLYFI